MEVVPSPSLTHGLGRAGRHHFDAGQTRLDVSSANVSPHASFDMRQTLENCVARVRLLSALPIDVLEFVFAYKYVPPRLPVLAFLLVLSRFYVIKVSSKRMYILG